MKNSITIHSFASSGLAYDATQCDDAVKTGDILVIESEGVVGVAHTWPFAVTEKHGDLHQLGEDANGIRFELADSIRHAEIVAKNMGRKHLLTPAAELIVGDLYEAWEITRVAVRENGKVAFDTKDIRTGKAGPWHTADSTDAFMVRRLIEKVQPEANAFSSQADTQIFTPDQARAVHSAMGLLSEVSTDDPILFKIGVLKDCGKYSVFVEKAAGGAILVECIGTGASRREDHEEYDDQDAFRAAYGLEA
jgi:hypothetical protein